MVGLASPPLEAGAWLAAGRRPLGRRLPPREPLRVCPRRRDRAEHEAAVACSVHKRGSAVLYRRRLTGKVVGGEVDGGEAGAASRG
jgi:hypothetical protein